MGFFGSYKLQYLQFEIHMTDQARVKALNDGDVATLAAVAAAGGGWQPGQSTAPLQSPYAASAEFGVPISDPLSRINPVPPSVQTGPFMPPAITSAWFVSTGNFPLDQRGFKRKSGGWFGISALFGDTVQYYWKRKFIYDAAVGTSGAVLDASGNPIITMPPLTAIAQRRWIDGFELPHNGEGTTGNQMGYSRDASRHPGGFGLAHREGIIGNAKFHQVDEMGGAAQVAGSWERIYIRLRQLPTAASDLWKMKSTPSPGKGMLIQVGPAGELLVSSEDAFGALTLHGALAGAPCVLNVWYRLDLFISCGFYFKVNINGIERMNLGGPPGLQGGTLHVSSGIGGYDGVRAVSGLEVDFDDWFNSELPTGNPVDMHNGSRMQLVRVTGIASPGTWSGGATGWRQQLQRCDDIAAGTPSVQASAAALDTIVYTTDAQTSIDAIPGQKGVAAFFIGRRALATGALAGRIGYSMNGAATVFQAAPNQNVQFLFARVFFNPVGVITPVPMGAFTITIEHSNNGQTESMGGVFAEVEVLGIFSTEDAAPSQQTGTIPLTEVNGGNAIHNAPYPTSPWARTGLPAPAPYAIVSGTYVGTGVAFDLKFAFPIHWLRIRRLTGTVDGMHWWSSMLGPHVGVTERVIPSLMPEVSLDPDWPPAAAPDAQETQTLARIGNDLQTNEVGVTYQYVAVSDAAQRIMLNAAMSHQLAATPKAHPLWTAQWNPQAAFFWQELVLGVGTASAWFKGIGHATNSGSPLLAAENANVGTFAPGVFTSGTGLPKSKYQVALNFWRRDDLSADAALPRTVQLVSYLGDGTGARVIALTPASGRRPLWAIIVPHNADGSIYRDPSHTGTTSHKVDNTINAATGITAGAIDAITVGAALNVAGITYEVFCLPGDTVAGNNGWSINGTFVVLQPGLPGDAGGDQMPTGDPAISDSVVGVGASPAELTGDLAANCTFATHKVLNIALSRLGVTQQVAALGTELTPEASQGRLHYTTEVEAVLRDFPWAFATRYVDPMTLVRGIAWSTTAVIQAWSAAATYAPGDVVVLAGVIWYAKLANVGTLPAAGIFWSLTPPPDELAVPLDSNDDWKYAYRIPPDLILARRLVRPGMARRFDATPPPFRIGQDANGNLLFTDQQAAVLEYTTRPVCAAGAGDALFREALSWRVAHALAPGLSKDAKKRTECWQMYLHTLERAKVANANEQQRQPNDGDAPWISTRDPSGDLLDPWNRR